MPEEAYDLYSGTYIKVATEEEIQAAKEAELHYFIVGTIKGTWHEMSWIDSIIQNPFPSLQIPPPPALPYTIIPRLAKPGRALQAYKPGAQPWKRK